MPRYEVMIPADHPSLPGHFPGHPVVPGVVVLSEVERCLRRHLAAPIRVTGIPSVKFLHPLLPATAFVIELEAGKPGTVKFQCVQGEIALATGSMTYESV